MSTFHKPKVFRSSLGCCICRAKSSSSRFTDSSRYEEELKPCFQLLSPRVGEICNACVLLVKRWRKLPRTSSHHWAHVVDARAGPGGRSSLARGRRREEEVEVGLYKIRRKLTKKSKEVLRVEEVVEGVEASKMRAVRLLEEHPLSSALSSSYWTRVESSCSCLVLVGRAGERAVDRQTVGSCTTSTTSSTRQTVGGCTTSSTPLNSVESLIEAELAALSCIQTKTKTDSLIMDEGYCDKASTVGSRSSYSPDSLLQQEEDLVMA